MPTTPLEEIVNIAYSDGGEASLEKLKAKLASATEAYNQASKDVPKDEEVIKGKKTILDKAKKDFDAQYEVCLKKIRIKVNEQRENEDLSVYSAEVAKRRATRNVSGIENDITEAQGSIDTLTLEIDAIDKDIEGIRKGLVPATNA